MQHTILLIILSSVLVLGLGLLLYVLYENRHFHVTTYQYRNKKLPKAFNQSVIIFLTDLHNYSYGDKNTKLLETIRKQKPDYIFIGGDMIVKGSGFDGTVALQLIKELAKEFPVYYAFGNHELRISTLEETKDTTYVEYINLLKSYGVQFVIDHKVSLIKNGQSIDLYGLNLPEIYYKKFKKIQLPLMEIKDRLGTPTKSRFNILLAHNPVYFPEYANWGADLVLSGHVHGGIVALPIVGGVMSTQGILFPKYDFGLYGREDATMILSRGLGNHTIHIRVNNHAELVKVVLKCD